MHNHRGNLIYFDGFFVQVLESISIFTDKAPY